METKIVQKTLDLTQYDQRMKEATPDWSDKDIETLINEVVRWRMEAVKLLGELGKVKAKKGREWREQNLLSAACKLVGSFMSDPGFRENGAHIEINDIGLLQRACLTYGGENYSDWPTDTVEDLDRIFVKILMDNIK